MTMTGVVVVAVVDLVVQEEAGVGTRPRLKVMQFMLSNDTVLTASCLGTVLTCVNLRSLVLASTAASLSQNITNTACLRCDAPFIMLCSHCWYPPLMCTNTIMCTHRWQTQPR
jgi:hypothetical protein